MPLVYRAYTAQYGYIKLERYVLSVTLVLSFKSFSIRNSRSNSNISGGGGVPLLGGAVNRFCYCNYNCHTGFS